MKHILFALLLLPLTARAESFDEAQAQFQKGYYNTAAKILATLPDSAENQYWLGLCKFKLQRYDESAAHFKAAEKRGDKHDDLHYQAGQAYFAAQKFPDSQAQFKASIVKKYKVGASAYYIAYSAQLEGKDELARDFYTRIQRLPSDPDKVKQAAKFQLADMDFSALDTDAKEDVQREYLKTKVLPAFEKIYAEDQESPVGKQAKTKISELENKIASLRPKMWNGNPTEASPFSLRYTQDVEYDSNVITKADQSTSQVTGKDSMILRPTVFTRYWWEWGQVVSVAPELSISSDYHSRRSTPNVYQNDNISFSPALRTKTEHKMFDKAATLLFDVEGYYMSRDYRMQHDYRYYNRYVNLVIGEKLYLFESSPTTFKLSYKTYESKDRDWDSNTLGLSVTQNINALGKSFYNTFSGDWLQARDATHDESNLKWRVSTTFTNVFPKWDFNPSLSVGLKDTRQNKATRGNELSMTPTLGLSHAITPKTDFSFSYAFTRNWSNDKINYQYKKHVATASFSFNL